VNACYRRSVIVSIHQPNFVPWVAYFDKVRSADVFVVMGHCQFEKNGFQNRFRYRDEWFTMPVSKKTEKIVEKKYVSPWDDWSRIKRRTSDGGILDVFDDCVSRSVFEMNTAIIRRTASLLGISTEIVSDSPTSLTGTNRLVSICQDLGAKTYLSGPSGRKYLEEHLFADRGISVEYVDSIDRRPLIEVLKHG